MKKLLFILAAPFVVAAALYEAWRFDHEFQKNDPEGYAEWIKQSSTKYVDW